MMFIKIPPPQSVGYWLILLILSFALQKYFSFIYQSLILEFEPLVICLGNSPLCQWVMLRSLIYLDLSFVQGDKHGSIFILLHTDHQLNQHCLLKIISFFFPTGQFWLLCQRSSVHRCMDLLWGLRFSSTDHTVSLCSNTMWFFFYHYWFVVKLAVRNGDSPRRFFFFFFNCWELLWLPCVFLFICLFVYLFYFSFFSIFY
jgi:hypothetical protein